MSKYHPFCLHKLPLCCCQSAVGSVSCSCVPQPVIESRDVKILWDFEVRTDMSFQSENRSKVISARRPDITVLDKRRDVVF